MAGTTTGRGRWPWPDRFWARIDTSVDGCWPYQGARGGEGYGQLEKDGRCKKAHRVVYELAVGPIPIGLDVLHRCDNPPCCNPAHLFLGTRGDNNRDRAAKGRSAKGERHGTHTHPERYRGERHSKAKLTEVQVRAIREVGAGEVALATQYGVSRRAIRSILARDSWGWLS